MAKSKKTAVKKSPAVSSGAATFARDDLHEALVLLAKVIEKRSTIPILECVMLEGYARKLVVTGTDLDNHLSCDLPSKGPGRWKAAISYEALQRLTKNIPAGAMIDLRYDGATGIAYLVSGAASYDLTTLPADAAQPPLVIEPTHSFELGSDVVSEMLKRVSFAISKEETRYYLNGIYLHPLAVNKRPVLRATATDGHRMALFDMKRPLGSTGMPGVIIPSKACVLLGALAGKVEALTFEIGKPKFIVRAGRFTLRAKLIDGTYPDYQRVVPVDLTRRVIVKPEAFGESIKRVASFKGGDIAPIKITLSDPGSAVVETRNLDYGTARETVPVHFFGEAMEIGFNSRYLADVFRAMDCEEIEIGMKDGSGPVLLSNAARPAHRCILMPMRV